MAGTVLDPECQMRNHTEITPALSLVVSQSIFHYVLSKDHEENRKLQSQPNHRVMTRSKWVHRTRSAMREKKRGK